MYCSSPRGDETKRNAGSQARTSFRTICLIANDAGQ